MFLLNKQVFNQYGQRNNTDLLEFYGFVSPNNPNDSILIQFTDQFLIDKFENWFFF
jgi:hypothetical protein